jgi:uncharacterized iron-regulated membrane protein
VKNSRLSQVGGDRRSGRLDHLLYEPRAMLFYKLFRKTHKWTGIILSLVFINTAATGFLLLIKKNHDWIQPPTRLGAEGGVDTFISPQKLFLVVFSQNRKEFRTLEDIDRVDFRPGKRVFKVRSRHRHAEIQVDAVNGAVLSVAWRPSDLLESLHDGSFFGDWCHGYLMPAAAGVLFFLSASGLYLWLAPLIRKRRRRKTAHAESEAETAMS